MVILGTLAAILALTALRYFNMWYIGATEDSGSVWIARTTMEPLATSFAFVRVGALAAPRFHAEVALVLTTLLMLYLLIWAGAMIYNGNASLAPVVTILFASVGSVVALLTSRQGATRPAV